MTPGRRIRSTAATLAAVTASAAALAASCRSASPPRAIAPAPTALPASAEAWVKAPRLRIGIVTDAQRASLGADFGVVVAETAGAGAGRRVLVQRATFRPAPARDGRPRVTLLETGDEFDVGLVVPQKPHEVLYAGPDSYRGAFEVRGESAQALTIVNVVGLEDYLRGVVPNELSPAVYPEIEALKAQAVAARTYALRNLGQFKSKGYDICATPACQVYKGRSTEHALSDQAVEATAGETATHRGQLINAVYSSTCGGHTEDGLNIFEGEPQPYLRGVACAPERSSWGSVRTTVPREPMPIDGLNRDLAMLWALRALDSHSPSQKWLRESPGDAELKGLLAQWLLAMRRQACPSPVEPPLVRRASFFQHLVSSLCWDDRARRLLAPHDADYLLQVEDRAGFSGLGERSAAALLLQDGIIALGGDNTLRPSSVLSRAQVIQILARAARRVGPPTLRSVAFRSALEGSLTVESGDEAETLAIDPGVALFRTLDGQAAAASEVALAPGDRLQIVTQAGRIVYLEVEQSRLGPSNDRGSRYFRWELRLTPGEVQRAIARYGSVGEVRDVEIRRLGVSGRVIELAVIGAKGELLLRGLKIRWGLGLRENLFVVDRERAEAGSGVASFVFTGKGWGHGVGLCQVGAYGMAQAGAGYEAILKHYYTGVVLSRPSS